MFTFVLCCLVLCYHVIPASISFHMVMLASITVDVGDGHASQYAMLSGYELLLIWWIVM